MKLFDRLFGNAPALHLTTGQSRRPAPGQPFTLPLPDNSTYSPAPPVQRHRTDSVRQCGSCVHWRRWDGQTVGDCAAPLPHSLEGHDGKVLGCMKADEGTFCPVWRATITP